MQERLEKQHLMNYKEEWKLSANTNSNHMKSSKGVSVYKPRVVFVVIYKIWKTVTIFLLISWITKKNAVYKLRHIYINHLDSMKSATDLLFLGLNKKIFLLANYL